MVGADLVALVGRVGDAMREKQQVVHVLAQALDDVGAERIGREQRQAAPGFDEQLVFGIERIVVGHGVGRVQLVFVIQLRGFEAPVLLEVVGAGAALAAAEIEHAATAQAGAAHQFPVHEIVAGQFARLGRAAAVIGQHLVAEVEAQHAADGAAILGDGQHFAVGAEHLLEQAEVFLGKDGRAEPVHAGGVGFEQALDVGVEMASRPALMPFLTMARCLRGIALRFSSGSAEMVLRKVTYKSLDGQSGWQGALLRYSRWSTLSSAASACAAWSSAARASASLPAMPPETQNGSELSEWPNSRLFTSASARMATIRPSRSAYRNQVLWPNASSITCCQPARWKKVASSQPATKASQRGRDCASMVRTCKLRDAGNSAIFVIATPEKYDPCGPTGSRPPVPANGFPCVPD